MRAGPDPRETAQLVAFRARLRILCARQEITLDALAHAGGCSKAYMNYIAHGQREPSLRLALAIARKLETTLTVMLAGAACAACGDLPPVGYKCLECGTETPAG